MKQIVEKIVDYKTQLANREGEKAKREVSRKEFTFLLSGIASFRKVPGITRHMGFTELYHCSNQAEEALVKKHLKDLFVVEDKESLLKACYIRYSGSREYEQFMTFFKEAPLFDVSKLQPEGARAFEMCKEIASHFYPILQEKGFYAWDINERICLCRVAAACGIISEEEFYEITDSWVRLAQVFYQSYEEYAISCLCGAVYQMARYEDSDSGKFLDLNIKVLEILFSKEGPWQINQWYVPKEREWVGLLEKNLGCFITKKALEHNYIGYMYHAEPDPKHPDSGWQFLYGDETQEYVDDPNNCMIVGLNTICNLHPDMLAYMHARVGSEFERSKEGWKAINSRR